MAALSLISSTCTVQNQSLGEYFHFWQNTSGLRSPGCRWTHTSAASQPAVPTPAFIQPSSPLNRRQLVGKGGGAHARPPHAVLPLVGPTPYGVPPLFRTLRDVHTLRDKSKVLRSRALSRLIFEFFIVSPVGWSLFRMWAVLGASFVYGNDRVPNKTQCFFIGSDGFVVFDIWYLRIFRSVCKLKHNIVWENSGRLWGGVCLRTGKHSL